MKRKLIILTILFSLLFGSANIYAATVMNSNLLDLIKSGLQSLKAYYYSLTDQELNNTNQKYIAEASKFVDSKSQEVINDIEQHQKSEMNRADHEINAYLDQLEEETDSAMQPEVETIKKGITDKVNQNIEQAKKDINKALEDSIKAQLKK